MEDILDRFCGQLHNSRIQEFCRKKWKVIIKKIPREVNAIRHALAGKIKAFPYASIVLQESPKTIVDQVWFDSKFLHDDI